MLMEEIRQRSHSDNSCDRGNTKYRTGVAEAARRAPPAAESVRAGGEQRRGVEQGQQMEQEQSRQRRDKRRQQSPRACVGPVPRKESGGPMGGMNESLEVAPMPTLRCPYTVCVRTRVYVSLCARNVIF